MKTPVLAGLGSLVLAASASAGFTGFAATSELVVSGDTTYSVMDIYATYDSADDVLLNIYNAEISITGGWDVVVHNDLVGTSWSPQFTSEAVTDSYVLIGGAIGFANSTNADPNWGGPGFNQAEIPSLAGWFNSNPPNLQGAAQEVEGIGFATRIAHIVILAGGANSGVFVDITASQTNNQGLGTPGEQGSATGSFRFAEIPAPGALALLGLAGLAGSRRRRA